MSVVVGNKNLSFNAFSYALGMAMSGNGTGAQHFIQSYTPTGEDPSKKYLNNIYNKYPAFKNMGEVTMKADPNFNTETTGAGNIEYFGTGQDRGTITYPNGYQYNHPKLGTHGIVYNPNTENEQTIMLDMMHGMTADPVYKKHRDEFKQVLMDKFPESYEKGKNRAIEMGMTNEDATDPKWRDEWVDPWVDGHLRNLMFEGTPDDFEKMRYWQGERDFFLSDPVLNEKFTQLQNYLKTGKGYVLPEVSVYGTAKK